MKQAGMQRVRFIVVAAALALAGAGLCRAQGLEVSVLPKGELKTFDKATEIAISFSRPMVAVGALPQNAGPAAVTLVPAVAGRFRWAGDRILKFQPAKPLPYATAFEVRIARGTRSLDGQTLAADALFRFSTPPPAVLEVTPSPGGALQKRDPLTLVFNQPVALAEIEAKVKLVVRAARYEIPEGYSVSSPEALAEINRLNSALAARPAAGETIAVKAWYEKGDPRRVVVAPTADLGLDATVTLLLPKGLRGTEGPLGSRQNAEFAFAAPHTPLFGGLSCRSCNPFDSIMVAFSNPLPVKELQARARLFDLTANGEAPRRNLDESSEYDWAEYGHPEHVNLGALFQLKAGHRYRLELPAAPGDAGRPAPGRTVREEFALQDYPPSLELVNRTGIIETAGPRYLSLKVMNVDAVRMEVRALGDEQIGTYLKATDNGQRLLVGENSPLLKLKTVRNVSTIVNIDIGRHLPGAAGVIYAEFAARDNRPGVAAADRALFSNGLLQVTDIGLSFKYSPHNSLLYIGSLATGAPLPRCPVRIFNMAGTLLWEGVSDERGLLPGPGMVDLGVTKDTWQPNLVVVARHGDDRAFLNEQWNSGIEGWSFNLDPDWRTAKRRGLGFLFSDRGAYRPGEEVFLKAVFRSDEADKLQLPPAGAVAFQVTDSRDKVVFKTSARLNALGAASFSFPLPADGPTGTYRITATAPAEWRLEESDFRHDILVAEYRKPDFRVDVTVARDDWFAGDRLGGRVAGAYLYGAPMKECAARWSVRLTPTDWAPPLKGPLADRPYVFRDWTREGGEEPGSQVAGGGEGTLSPGGELAVEQPLAFVPYPQSGVLEGEVTDVTRQAIANRTAFRLHPTDVYVGLESGAYFVESGKTFRSALAAVDIDGNLRPGKAIRVELLRREWHSVQEKQEGAYYRYRSEAVDTPLQTLQLTSAAAPLPLEFPVTAAGYYLLRATYSDEKNRTVRAGFGFYCLGGGFVAWERYDHNRMDLVPEKKRYNPGETARILVKSPWPEADGIVTIERTGVIESRPLHLSGSAGFIEVPVRREHIPEVFVSVLLVKGRTADKLEAGVDVGKPTFRLGYARLEVVPDEVRLAVDLSCDKPEYRPKEPVSVALQVRNRAGRPVPAEVTLYAVDYGVLSLTGYKTPDLAAYFYGPRGLGVKNADSRLVLISRDYLKGKLAEEAGGGGRDNGALALRRDFRPTPFWSAELMTDARGRAGATFTLPDSLTTFVVMAVVHTADSNFGAARREIRVSKPLMLFPALPRFLLAGDRCAGAVRVQNNTPLAGTLTLKAQSLNRRLDIAGGEWSAPLAANASLLLPIPLHAVAAGRETVRLQARFQAAGREESDAVEIVMPVNTPRTRIDAAAYGSTEGRDATRVALPGGISPDQGGLRVSVSSSALTELQSGAEFLLDYPYGCSEQLASQVMPFIALKNMAGAFSFRGIDARQIEPTVAAALAKLYKNRREDGGFGMWSDSSVSSAYISAYVLVVLKMAENRGLAIDAGVKKSLVAFLRKAIKQKLGAGRAGELVTKAFILYALAQNDVVESSYRSLVYEQRETLPLLVRGLLLAAASRDRNAALIRDTLRGEILNAARLEAATAHFEEAVFDGQSQLMHSGLRSNAVILLALLDAGESGPLPEKVAAYLLARRRNGAWRNTQENAWALLALSEYFRRRESQPVDFEAQVRLGDRKLPAMSFREIRSEITSVAMSELARLARNGELPVSFEKKGSGRLFWNVNLAVYPTGTDFQELDQGVRLQRLYEDPASGARKSAFRQGDLVRVRLKLKVDAEKNFLAVCDPVPAGCEIQDLALQTTRRPDQPADGQNPWYFNHVETYDDRLQVFADRLPAGEYDFVYVIRATSAGTFLTPAAKAEEMYNPEVFGTSRADTIRID